MKVCSECFEDTDIKQRIRSINKKGTCDIHNEINYIYDTDLDEGLKNTYTSLKEDWNIFSFKPKPEDIRKFLSSLLEKPLPKNVNTIIPELESEEEISKQSMFSRFSILLVSFYDRDWLSRLANIELKRYFKIKKLDY